MKRLILSIAVTFTSLMLAIFTAFAWFSSNDTVTAEDAMVSVSTSDKIKVLKPTVYALTNSVNGYVKVKDNEGNDIVLSELYPYNNTDGKVTTALIEIDYEVTEPGYYRLNLSYNGAMYDYSAINDNDKNKWVTTFLSNALTFWNVSTDNGESFNKNGLNETFLHYDSTSQHYAKNIKDWAVTGNALRIGIDEEGNPIANPVLAGKAYVIIDYSESLINELYTAILNNAGEGETVTDVNLDFTSDLVITMDEGSQTDWVEPDVYYTFMFDSNGGLGRVDPQTLLSTANITIPATGISRENHILVGWTTKADGTGTLYNLNSIVPVKNIKNDDSVTVEDYTITLYAKWSIAAYNINYDANTDGATGNVNSTIAGISGNVTLSQNKFNKQFYKQTGWALNPEGTGTVYSLGQPVDVTDLGLTENNPEITLYAVWQENAYTVSFDKNDANATGEMSSQRIDIDTRTKLNTNQFLNRGYAFAGWNTAPDGSGTTYANEEQVLGLKTENGQSITLYAIWSTNTYTVNFNSNKPDSAQNEVEGLMESQTIEVGVSTKLTANAFTLVKYNFLGWNTASDGSGTNYIDQATVRDLVPIAQSITLYAMWQETFTISFEDGLFSTNVPDITGVTQIPNNLPILEHDGYYFFGWYNVNLTEKVPSGMALDSDITLYAKWHRELLKDDFSTGSDVTTGYQGKAAHQKDVNWTTGLNLYVKHKTASTDSIAESISVYEEVDTDDNNNYLGYNDGAYTLVDNNNALATIAYINLDEPVTQAIVYGKFDITFTAADSNNWSFFQLMGTYEDAYGELFAIRNNADNILQYRIHDNSESLTTINANLIAKQNSTYTIEFEIDINTGEVKLTVIDGASTYTVTFTDEKFNAVSAISLSSSETGSKSVILDNLLITTTSDILPSVRFYSDSTMKNKISTQIIDNEGKVSFPSNLSLTGYTWDGWYKEDGTKVDSNYTFVGGEKVYAKLNPITYKVKFNANGGNGGMADQTFTYDQAQTLTICSFAHPDGNAFLGWATSSGGSVVYQEGEEVLNLTSSNGTTINLYAVWAD